MFPAILVPRLTPELVTGGAGTLALEGARALLEHGLSGLALFDLNPQHAAGPITALITDFPDAKIITKQVDVRDTESIVTAVKETAERLGSIDVLCCFAGVVGCTHALDMSVEEWKRTIDINSTGSFLCAQAVAK
jgi:NAD(P)-dependent dehydrogenase (short-subunit alcohol dehydrogenase family)